MFWQTQALLFFSTKYFLVFYLTSAQKHISAILKIRKDQKDKLVTEMDSYQEC